MDTIKIGGKDVKIRLREAVCMKIIQKFNRIYATKSQIRRKNLMVAQIQYFFEGQRADLLKLKEADAISDQEYQEKYRASIREESIQANAANTIIPDVYFYWACWKIMAKRGIWPFRYPFRSFRHMRKEIERGEAIAVIHLINKKILGYKIAVDDGSKKKD